MILKSKLRLDILFSTIIVLGIMLIAPYQAYLKSSEKFDDNYFKEPSIFLLFIFAGIIYVGCMGYLIYEIVTKTLIITINKTDKTILFNYPFKFKKKTYLFDQVDGFRFSSFHTRICDFKTIILKTKGEKSYTISEYQIANFNKFETFALENFSLKKDSDFKSLIKVEEIEELRNNESFNIEQAKTYRTTCYFHIALIGTLLIMNAYLAIPDRKFGWITYSFLGVFFIFLLYKIKKANSLIKK